MTWDYSLTGARVCAFTRAKVYSFDMTRDYSLPRAGLLLARYFLLLFVLTGASVYSLTVARVCLTRAKVRSLTREKARVYS